MATIYIPGILRIRLLVGLRSLRCGKSGCSGYMNDDEFGFKLQTDKCLKEGGKKVMEVDKLPWPEGFDLSSPHVKEFMSEMNKVVPPNGRFVVLFKAKCGCPYAKIEAWSSEDCKRRHVAACIEERIKSGEAMACSICEKNYANISEIKELPCSHSFHRVCIDNMLKINDLCPVCDSLDNSRDKSWEDSRDDSSDDFVMV